MEFLRGIKEGLSRRSRKLGIAMALLVLAAAFYFSRQRFWEEATSRAEENRLILIDAGHGEHMVSLHNGKIVFNEEVIKPGVTGLTAIALEYLNQ